MVKDNDLNTKADEPEDVQDTLKKVVAGVNAQMLTATLTDWFTTILIAKFVENTLMCRLMLIYIRQFVALSPLLVLFNIFLETNMGLMEKVVKTRKDDVKDGYIRRVIYMPGVFLIQRALADENEFVKKAALKAGQRIANNARMKPLAKGD